MLTKDQANRIGDLVRMLRARLQVQAGATHDPDDRQELRSLIADCNDAIAALISAHVPPYDPQVSAPETVVTQKRFIFKANIALDTPGKVYDGAIDIPIDTIREMLRATER